MHRRVSSRFLASILSWALLVAGAAQASVQESEPNGSPATADVLPTGPYGEWGSGSIGAGTSDEDWWRVEGVSTGSLLFAYINDDHPFNDGQPWLEAYANDGATAVEAFLPERIAGAVVPQNGTVYLRMREQANNDNLNYIVLQYVGPASDQASEVEPNGSPGQATPITAGVMAGTVSGSDVDYYSFTVDDPAEDWIVVIIDNDPDDNGSSTQSVVDLVDGTGTSIAYRADGFVSSSSIAEAFSVSATGTYYFKVATDVWSEDTDYRFVLLLEGSAVGSRQVFTDDFETGDTGQWSVGQP